MVILWLEICVIINNCILRCFYIIDKYDFVWIGSEGLCGILLKIVDYMID